MHTVSIERNVNERLEMVAVCNHVSHSIHPMFQMVHWVSFQLISQSSVTIKQMPSGETATRYWMKRTKPYILHEDLWVLQ